MSTVNKMINAEMTVVELKAAAKARGLKGYSKLRKPELLQLFHGKHVDAANDSIVDAPVPNIQVQTPTPSSDVPTSHIRKIWNAAKYAFNTFSNWFLSYISPEPKRIVNDKPEALQTKVNTNKNKFEIRESKSAIKGFAKQYTINGMEGIDPESFLDSVQPKVINLISGNRMTKINLVLTCTMERVDLNSGEVITGNFSFVSKTQVVLACTDVGDLYKNARDKILETIANFQMRGSNWRFLAVVKMDVNTAIYKPLKGKSYIQLPSVLANKKAIINMKNEDDQCFKWCVARALNPADKDQERITKILRKQAENLNWNEVKFPVNLNDIDKFERHNVGISVNVFGYDGDVYPLRLSKVCDKVCDSKIIDLLLIADDSTQHYCLIKNLSRLLTAQTGGHTVHYCRRCLNGFREIKSLAKHNEYCSQHDAQKIEVPEPGTLLQFKNYNRSMRVPFIVYADFESFIKPIDSCLPNGGKSYTHKYQKHTPSSFCYYVKCFDDAVYSQEPVVFTAKSENDDVAQIFVDTLEENIKQIYKQFKFKEKMIFTEVDAEMYSDANTCHICDCELGSDKVRDHCHLSGKFRGAAHYECNINYQVPKFFPVVFHNLSGYDSHLFIKKLRGDNGEKINCIPTNEEKYISFSREVIVDKFVNEEGEEKLVKRELRFIDSFRFMASSLDALSKNLHKDQCKNLKKFYSGKQLDLLLRKGVYPYEYIDSVDRLSETELPPKSAFYSKLNDSDISDEDYEHAQTVWKEFGFKTLREYHDLYHASDVLLLAGVFENFRDTCLNRYKLDPAWYYTSPGLAWDAALKLTSIELELLSDYDMILMIKHGIRGGISTISNRYARANNKYMGEAFDCNKPSSYISYLDANNLYGWAMSKPLPTNGFKWMSEDKLNNWKSSTSQEGVGCILEVDLEYPKEQI